MVCANRDTILEAVPNDLDERIIRRKAQRFKILQDLYRRKLDGYEECEAAWIAQDVNMDLRVALEHLDFLRQHGLVKTTGWSQKLVFVLTHTGEVEVELVRSGQETRDFPMQIQNYIHVGRMHQSQIQQGTESSTATFNLSNFDANRPKFEQLFQSLRKAIEQSGLDSELRAELEPDLAAAEALIKAEKPKPGPLREILKSMRSIAERASGTVLAKYVPQIIELLHSLGDPAG